MAAQAVFEKRDGMTVIRMPEGRPFRILQLTDIHIGGGLLSRKKDRLALDAVGKIVRASHADLVVVTGDMVYPLFMYSGTSNNLKASKKFGECMDSLGVPWTFTFGNHDEECIAFYKKECLADYYMTLKSCLFEKGDPALTGVGNHAMRLETADGKPVMMLMMVDSNSYTGGTFFSGFDTIHDDQIDWYEKVIRENSAEGSVIPSLAFFHIPPTRRGASSPPSPFSTSRPRSSRRAGRSATAASRARRIISVSWGKRINISAIPSRKRAISSRGWWSSAASKASLWGTIISTLFPSSISA